MNGINLVVGNNEDNLGGVKCRLRTNRYANSNCVIEIVDFEIDTTNVETIARDLESFKQFQNHIKDLEFELNQPKKEVDKQ